MTEGADLLKLTPEMAQKWFYEIDMDGSGEISALEFVDMYERLTTPKVKTAFTIKLVNGLNPGEGDYEWMGGAVFTSGPTSLKERLVKNFGTTRWIPIAMLDDENKGFKVNDSVSIEIEIKILKDSVAAFTQEAAAVTMPASHVEGGDLAAEAEAAAAAAAAEEEEKKAKERDWSTTEEKRRKQYDIAMRSVKRSWEAIEHIPEFLHDPPLVMEAISQNWRAIAYVSEELLKDRDFMMKAVKLSWCCLQYASADIEIELIGDRNIVMEAVTQDGRALEFASGRLQEDRMVVLSAVKSNGRALQFASEELRGDREIVMEAVKNYIYADEYASSAFVRDKEFRQEVIKQRLGGLR